MLIGMSEPKRPPPPKSYVPLLLLDDEPTPELPPRPVIGSAKLAGSF